MKYVPILLGRLSCYNAGEKCFDFDDLGKGIVDGTQQTLKLDLSGNPPEFLKGFLEEFLPVAEFLYGHGSGRNGIRHYWEPTTDPTTKGTIYLIPYANAKYAAGTVYSMTLVAQLGTRILPFALFNVQRETQTNEGRTINVESIYFMKVDELKPHPQSSDAPAEGFLEYARILRDSSEQY